MKGRRQEQNMQNCTRTGQVAEYRQMLLTSLSWRISAVLIIYARQLQDEQFTRETIHKNDIGFNQVDSKPLSIIAEKLQSGYALSPQEHDTLRRRIIKYAGQLWSIAQDKKGS